MYQGYRVNVVTPAGRKDNLDVLEPYVLRDRGLVDKWTLWVNTPHHHDVDHIHSLAARHPDFVTLVHSERPLIKGESRPQNQFFKTAIDPQSLFVKVDDDTVFLDRAAIETLLKFRLDHPDPLIVSSNVVMNGICSSLHYKFGAQTFLIDGEYQRIPPECCNKVWSEVKYAEYVHRTFINDRANGDTDKYLFDSWSLDNYQRFAINCICWKGSDFAEFGGVIDHNDEELWLSCIKSRELKRKVVICGQSLVAHHAYYKHRKPFCDGKPIDPRILRAYKAISENKDPKSVLRILDSKSML